MAISLYEATVVPFIKHFKTTKKLLEKGKLRAGGNGDKIKGYRLIEDMGDLTYQIQRMSDTAKGLIVRLANAERVVMEDNEKTLQDLIDRIDKTLKILEALKPDCMDGSENKDVSWPTPQGDLKFTGAGFAIHFAVPNFYFHYCMVYALLRKEGVDLGKANYMGA